MKKEYETIDEFKKDWSKEEIKRKISYAWWKTKRFVDENKELVMLVGPMIGGGIAALWKGGIRRSNLNKEEHLKKTYCYDRSLGHYWKLKRELTNDEWVRIERRRRDGERLGDILAEMRVLK